MENQQKVWNNIAEEWNKFKQIPSEFSKEFLNKCTGKVLDLGCGSGRHLAKIENGKMHLVDFSGEMIELAEVKSKKLKIPMEGIVADMKKLPFEENFFDYAICISALHCVEGKKNRERVVEELYRVMKPGSKSLIGVWNFNSKRFRSGNNKNKERAIKWTDKGSRYYYLFDEKEVHDLFKKSGFRIISSHNSEMMINFIVEK